MSLPPPPPQTIVIFGASGDLTRRKLLPALYQLSLQGLLPERYGIVGYARTNWDDDSFRAEARAAVEASSRSPVEEKQWKAFADSLSYVAGAFDGPACFGPLAGHLARLDDQWSAEGRRLYYCATPPSAYPHIAGRLGECGVAPAHRIVVEKPFGRDLGTAGDLNHILHGAFAESQVFRIDHYLGKETVQNLLVLRFANSMFERVWNRDAIDHVQITVAESVGLEGRGSYYEEAGALRDMLQNHLLQVLAILAMEPPRALDAEAIRDEKVKVLRALRPLDPAGVVRGQYTAGTLDGQPVPGYRDEPGVAPASTTPTYVAARAHVENWRWAGVPFYLRTGKRLPQRTTEVVIGLREAPAPLFETAGVCAPEADHLVIRIQPEEGISFAFQAKQPGPGFTPTTVRMDFSYGESFAGAPAEAYERLLYDALVGDRTLFIREDGIERSWEVVTPALEHPGPVHPYPAGSWGPAVAEDLLAPRRWHLR